MMYSYVQIEKTLSKAYREKLGEEKSPQKIQEIFSQNILTLLSKISDDFSVYEVPDIKLLPGKDIKYRLSERMKNDSHLSSIMKESDLPAIFDRWAKDASNRYMKLINDNDKTGTFKLPPKVSKMK